MLTTLQNAVRKADSVVARAYLRLVRERPALLVFLFHSLFRDESEIERNLIDPLDRTTVDRFRDILIYFSEHGYRFVGPDEIAGGLDPSARHVALTFDDGYYNNRLALPVLEEFNAPATFLISTEHVRRNRCFWWDVLYREMTERGETPNEVARESLRLKAHRNEDIETKLKARFGESALIPRGDIDRPFDPSELRDFAGHPLVHVGNHTASHAILTNYGESDALAQIDEAQRDLFEMTGARPTAIAYPNGAFNDHLIRNCAKRGLKVGFTIRPKKNRLPLPPGDTRLLRLGRFTPHSHDTIANQCTTYRSDVQVYGSIRSSYVKLCRNSFSN